jgi:N-acetylglucosaminyldiphosphoundecaprenol N-acetyl-beta-D-mannosaminyltransferase
LDEAVNAVARAIREGERGYLCTVNVAILMMMRGDPRLQRYVDRARWVVADGQPLIWAARLGADPLPERVAGVDLIEVLCERAQADGFGVYLLGADAATVEATARALRAKFPRLDLRGYADGYFGAAQASERARAVAESGAKLLLVAMGVPRQEHFIEEQWENLGASVAIGVGGSFDVIAGLRKRAPALLQRTGFEWAFRLVQEPRRLFMRYLVTNSQFVGLVSRDLVLGRIRPGGGAHRG